MVDRLAGIPYSFTAHADDIFVRRPMLEEKVGAAAFVIAISDFNRRLLAQQIGDDAARRIRVVHCGVPVAEFAPLPPAGASHPFTILCVGRLEPKKGQRHLIEACRILRERGIAFRCWLVGEGRERARLERARDAAGLGDSVELLGARSRSEVRALVADAHVFALPSVVAADGRTDGIPVALMEAMALARPVVSTLVSGIPELVADGHSGRLVAPGDAVALADAIEAIQRDADHATQLAREAARRVRERFDVHENAAELMRLFAGTAPMHEPFVGSVVPSPELEEVGQ
jgi:glycosyltransferase involved in cell wall biosynthesis